MARGQPWCVRFWGRHTENDTSYGLWGAANRALEQPETAQTAGRLTYIYMPQILGGTLYCQLPSGRCLTYRGIKYERVDELDDDDQVIGRSIQLRFWKAHGRATIWHGTLCENVVQATAADILRGTLVRLEQESPGVRLHSHDEVPDRGAARATSTTRSARCARSCAAASTGPRACRSCPRRPCSRITANGSRTDAGLDQDPTAAAGRSSRASTS